MIPLLAVSLFAGVGVVIDLQTLRVSSTSVSSGDYLLYFLVLILIGLARLDECALVRA